MPQEINKQISEIKNAINSISTWIKNLDERIDNIEDIIKTQNHINREFYTKIDDFESKKPISMHQIMPETEINEKFSKIKNELKAKLKLELGSDFENEIFNTLEKQLKEKLENYMKLTIKEYINANREEISNEIISDEVKGIKNKVQKELSEKNKEFESRIAKIKQPKEDIKKHLSFHFD